MAMPLPIIINLLAIVLGALTLAPGPTLADVTVATTQELKTALSKAEPGETVRLAPGQYANVSLRGVHGHEDRPLTLTSADPSDLAKIADMRLNKSSHVVLDGLMFDYIFEPGDEIHLRPFQITDSRDITVRNSVFDGDLAQGVSADSDGFGFAFGLGVRGVDGITIESNEVRTFYRGMAISRSQDVVVRNNNVHSLRMDGMDFAQIQNGLIEGNHIHDFKRSPNSRDHADMIQFWTNRTTEPTKNVTIRGNVLNSGEGLYTQSIFMRNDLVDRGLAGDEMFYRDITIEDNVIVNAHLHGISIGETDGLTIRNNSVIRNAQSEGERDNVSLWNPRISASPASRDVSIVNNVVSRINGFERQDDWDARDNFLIQDQHRLRPGFYGQVFANAIEGDPSDLSSFLPKEGGPLDGADFGAPMLSRE